MATTLGNLGTNLSKQARYAEAEAVHRRALEIRLRILDPADPHLALTLNNLATTLDEQNRQAEAEALHRRAVDIVRKARGDDHPETTMAMNNLAGNLDWQGKAEEVADLRRRVLAIRERTLPANHPDIAVALNNLAASASILGNVVEEERLRRRALAVASLALRADAPDLALYIANLGWWLVNHGRQKEGTSFLRRAHSIYARVHPGAHPSVIEAQVSLASALLRGGGTPEARTRYRIAAVGVDQRMRAFRDFNSSAQTELRRYRPLFLNQVEASWRLGTAQ